MLLPRPLYPPTLSLAPQLPVQALALAESRLGVTHVNLKVRLSDLQPGEYQCQVTVLDATGNRAAFWQGPIMLAR